MATLRDLALENGIALNLFCESIMKEWQGNRNNLFIEEFVSFIVDGYEHPPNHQFNGSEASSWDFLLKEGLIQYAESLKDEDRIEYILNAFIVPKYPILALMDYEARIGDLNQFEGVSVRLFQDELKRILSTSGFNSFLSYKVLIHAAIEALAQVDSKLVPYGYFLLNIPIELLQSAENMTASASSASSVEFADFFRKFAGRVYEWIKRNQPGKLKEILSSLVPVDVYESVKSQSFPKLMNSYASTHLKLIEKDPLEAFLIEIVDSEDLEQILLLQRVLMGFNGEIVAEAVNLAVRKGNLRIVDFLMRNGPGGIDETFNGAIQEAFECGQRDILEHLLKSGVRARKAFDFGYIVYEIIRLGYWDLAEDIVNERHYPLTGSTDILLHLIRNGPDHLLKKVLELPPVLLGNAIDWGEVEKAAEESGKSELLRERLSKKR